MPKVAHDFSKEIIFYIIKCNDVEKTEIYVGSTFNFVKRKTRHRSNCINPNMKNHNIKVYVYIRENGGWDNFNMTMLDRKVCIDMLEARKYEQTLITQYKANLNSRKAFGAETKKEYKSQYDLEHKEEQKQYRIENDEKIKERKKQDYIKNLTKIKEKGKQYRLENVEKLKEKKKQDYIKKSEKLKEKITCECGTVCCRASISDHIKTKKHQSCLATKESVEIV